MTEVVLLVTEHGFTNMCTYFLSIFGCPVLIRFRTVPFSWTSPVRPHGMGAVNEEPRATSGKAELSVIQYNVV